MTVTTHEIIRKIREIHPEIGRFGLDVSAMFDESKNAWIVTLTKGTDTLSTHLEPEDARECLEGRKCVFLGNQIGQFIEAYCLGSCACSV